MDYRLVGLTCSLTTQIAVAEEKKRMRMIEMKELVNPAG